MRKMVFFLLLVVISGFACADESESGNRENEEAFLTVSMLIKDNLNKNFFQIQQESLNLTNSQRLMLYGLHENRFGTPLAFNLLLGFGIGSFVQTDTVGGIVGLAGDTAGLIVLISYFVSTIQASDWLTSRIRELDSQIMADPVRLRELEKAQEEYNKKLEDALPLVYISAGILSVIRIFEIIKPITYSNGYNNKLRQALYNNNLSFNLVPSIDINGNGTLVVSASYRY